MVRPGRAGCVQLQQDEANGTFPGPAAAEAEVHVVRGASSGVRGGQSRDCAARGGRSQELPVGEVVVYSNRLESPRDWICLVAEALPLFGDKTDLLSRRLGDCGCGESFLYSSRIALCTH